MQLEHSFSVPAGIDEAWRLLLDIERTAPCIPGATIESVDGHEITGAIKVRLGTIGPTYKGSATVSEMDPAGRRAIVNAHGESRSSGSATAKVIATLSEFGGSTSVMLMTEIDFTGKPAQLEQTVISDAGARIVRQFAERLAALLAKQAQDAPTQEPAAPDGVAATPVQHPRPKPRPRPSPAAPETATSAAPTPAAASTPAASTPGESSDRTVPRHANSAKPHVEVIPSEPPTGLELLLKRLAPFAVLVIILLLRRRRRRLPER